MIRGAGSTLRYAEKFLNILVEVWKKETAGKNYD
jgi:hypothetical protein